MLQFIYTIKRKSWKPQTESLEPAKLLLFSNGIKSDIGQNITSEISTLTIRGHLHQFSLRECLAQKKKYRMSHNKNYLKAIIVCNGNFLKSFAFLKQSSLEWQISV